MTFYKPNNLSKNLVYFKSMLEKDKYLAWREKNGMFTAVDIDNMLSSWSMKSG